MKLSVKVNKLKKLIAQRRYYDISNKLLNNVAQVSRNLKYLYLRKKFSSFIKEHTYEKPTGVGHENVIWWLWLQGEDQAPEVCKACLASLRHWHSEKKIIILDENNFSEYVRLPDYIQEKYERGILSRTYYSDLIRLQLLLEHGGIWIDSTVLCVGRKFEELLHLPLFAYRSNSMASAFSSWLIACDPHDPILQLTMDLQLEYWREYNS